jgi:hypothetical protein
VGQGGGPHAPAMFVVTEEDEAACRLCAAGRIRGSDRAAAVVPRQHRQRRRRGCLLAAAASSAFETPTCEIFTPSAFMASGHVEPVRQIRRVDQRSTIPQHETEFMSRRSRHHRVPVIVRRALVIGASAKSEGLDL